MLNGDVILSLNKHKICTLADFMREDESRLMKIMDIDGKWILTFDASYTMYNIQFYFI